MARLSATACLLSIAVASGASAQEEAGETDLTLPPQIDPESAPGEARLEPPPEEREDVLEAVVTAGQTDWRLPDLGSSFRAREEERDPNQRMEVTFLYLYDPENEDPAEEIFPTTEEQLGVGVLKIFELRFGRRSRE